FGWARTVVNTLAELLVGSGSGLAEDTVAVSVMTPGWIGVTTTVTEALPPLATVPREHVTRPASSEQDPWLGVAETKMAVEGRVSVTTTSLPASGPLLVTLIE